MTRNQKKYLNKEIIKVLIVLLVPFALNTTLVICSVFFKDALVTLIIAHATLALIAFINIGKVVRKNENYYMYWSLIIMFIPLYGPSLYFAIGSFSKKYRIKFIKRIEDRISTFNQYISEENIYNLRPVEMKKYKIYTSGFDKFQDLFNDIKNAKSKILLQYFIIYEDFMYQTLLELLEKKVKEGVEVKISTDYGGSIALNKKLFLDLNKKGIKSILGNSNLNYIYSGSMNHRNHRKFALIDDKITYFGGMNLAIYYGGMSEKYGMWHDIHFRVDSKSFNQESSNIFDFDFKYDSSLYENEPLKIRKNILTKSDTYIFDDGPDIVNNTFLGLLLEKINESKEKINFCMPYPIFPKSIEKALVEAKKRGVEIQIIAPGTPDKKSAYWVSYAIVKKMNKKGVSIQRTNGTFMHSKLAIIDNEVLTGTSNVDYRSLYQHFETNLYSSNKDIVKDLSIIFETYLNLSSKIKYKFKWVPVLDSFAYNFSKLFIGLL